MTAASVPTSPRTSRSRNEEAGIAVPLVSLLTLAVASVLVTIRGEIQSEVVALVLAATVAIGARVGGRAAGIAAALMAAVSYDFFFTRPYLSLKITDGNDILATLLLLVVGVVVGGLAARANADHESAQAAGGQGAAVRRVLRLAADGDTFAVTSAVEQELVGLLRLEDCHFTTGTSNLPPLGAGGELHDAQLRYHDDGFELPLEGFTIAVVGSGRQRGLLVCHPQPDVGVDIASRRTAVALAEVLGLVLGMADAAAR